MVSKEFYCRLCLNEAADNGPIIDLNKKNAKDLTAAGTLLKKHFWFEFGFNETTNLSAIICQKCWTYVKSFDDFYNLTRCKHQEYFGQDLNYAVSIKNYADVKTDELPNVTEFKEEPFFPEICVSDLVVALPLDVNNDQHKEEIVESARENVIENIENNANDDDDDFFNYSDDDSDEDYLPSKSAVIKSETAAISSEIKKPQPPKVENDFESTADEVELMRKYFKMECDQCSAQFETFAEVTVHYKEEHSMDTGYLYCCDKKFTKMEQIRQHCLWHENPDAFKCVTCDKSFLSGYSLRSHLQIHSTTKTEGRPPKDKDMDLVIRSQFEIKCDVCSEKLDNFSGVVAHFKNVHKQNGYLKCCDKKFFRRNRIFEHCQYHKNPDLWKCSACAKTFIDNKSLNFHMLNMHAQDYDKKYKCNICPKSYVRGFMLNRHKLLYHNIRRPDTAKYISKKSAANKGDGSQDVEKQEMPQTRHECHICHKTFKQKRTVRYHILNVHESKFAKMCDVCARIFQSEKTYQLHYLNEHTDLDLKVQCELCGKWLKHKEGLKMHMRFHGAASEQCTICGKTTSNKRALRGHMKLFHSDPDVPCTICEKMFRSNAKLKEHMATHTGNYDVYTCVFCPTTFRSSSTMYKHRKEAHPIEYAEGKASGFIK